MDKVKKSIDVYNAIAQKYADTFDADFSDNPRIDVFLSHIPRGALVIDVGCGTGAVTNYIQSKGMKVVGVDLSQAMLEIAKRNYPEIKFWQEDMRYMNYPDESFDAIWAGHSLFHLTREEFEKVLTKFCAMLEDGGILGLVINEGEGDVDFVEPLDRNLKIPLTLYTDTELSQLLYKAGFKIISKFHSEPITDVGFKPFSKLFVIAMKNKII